MKRIYIVGLCLTSVMAFSALASASASAAPEYGSCKLLGKHTTPKAKHGAYESGCTTLNAKHKGFYEWVPGPAPTCVAQKKGEYTEAACVETSLHATGKTHKGHFEKDCAVNCADISASGGAAFLEGSSSHLKIECNSNGSEKGAILSSTDASGVAKYNGCHIETFGVKCKSLVGAATEEIKTFELAATPIEIGGKVWIQYSAGPTAPEVTTEHGNAKLLAEFECEIATLRVSGTADGVDAGNINTMSVTSTQTFSTALGNQTLFSEKKTSGSFGEGEFSTQNQASTFSTEDSEGGEIRT